jgi:hypothetical protein
LEGRDGERERGRKLEIGNWELGVREGRGKKLKI